ncbi:MAG TPA: multidrug effflux MFS transporter [Allosphingosinicella sp.]|nr:multidrug effflux MFS transporter [Allosphingosinicella sp.]
MSAIPNRAGRMPGKREFVVLMAALMASNALAIDAMLPALPAIGEALGVAEENRRQLVITFYLLGFGGAQIAYGPLADRYGRKVLLVASMLLYALFGALAGIAGSFTLLLAARAMQGVAAAGTRVLVVAIVRDRFHGSAMAQIMSLVMIIFMIVPVLAPTFGQGVLAIASWRHIFIGLAVYGLLLASWAALRLPETLSAEARRPLSAANIGAAAAETLSIRASIGNTVAATLTFGALFAFIGSIQQIVFDVFERPGLIGLAFACIAGPMAGSSYANSRLVIGLGSRRLLLAALAAFTLSALAHLAVALAVGETIWTFILMQALTMACFGLIGANAGALAMAPLGHIAGTASALQGLITTVGGALIGFVIGQQFDGTTVPMIAGFAICGTLALVVALWANPPSREAKPAR